MTTTTTTMMMMIVMTIMTNQFSPIHYVFINTMAQQYRCQEHRQHNTQIQSKYTDDKSKAIPLQTRTVPEGARRLKASKFQDDRHMKVVRLSALRTGRLNPQQIFLVLFLLAR